MPKIIRFHETGGADVLKVEDLPLIEPGEGEVRLKVEAIGLNRAEVMFRFKLLALLCSPISLPDFGIPYPQTLSTVLAITPGLAASLVQRI